VVILERFVGVCLFGSNMFSHRNRNKGGSVTHHVAQASLAVDGITLEKFLNDPTKSLKDDVDLQSFSAHIVCSIIINPMDGHARNFIVTSLGTYFFVFENVLTE
jgi:hypothetical protein